MWKKNNDQSTDYRLFNDHQQCLTVILGISLQQTIDQASFVPAILIACSVTSRLAADKKVEKLIIFCNISLIMYQNFRLAAILYSPQSLKFALPTWFCFASLFQRIWKLLNINIEILTHCSEKKLSLKFVGCHESNWKSNADKTLRVTCNWSELDFMNQR